MGFSSAEPDVSCTSKFPKARGLFHLEMHSDPDVTDTNMLSSLQLDPAGKQAWGLQQRFSVMVHLHHVLTDIVLHSQLVKKTHNA